VRWSGACRSCRTRCPYILTSYTLHPHTLTLYTLHPHTLHPHTLTLYTLHPTPYTLTPSHHPTLTPSHPVQVGALERSVSELQGECKEQHDKVPILKLTCWVAGTNLSTLERERARGKQIGDPK